MDHDARSFSPWCETQPRHGKDVGTELAQRGALVLVHHVVVVEVREALEWVYLRGVVRGVGAGQR